MAGGYQAQSFKSLNFLLRFDKITSLISGLLNFSKKCLKTNAGSDVSKILAIIGHYQGKVTVSLWFDIAKGSNLSDIALFLLACEA